MTDRKVGTPARVTTAVEAAALAVVDKDLDTDEGVIPYAYKDSLGYLTIARFTSRVVFDGDSIMEGSGTLLLKNMPSQIGLSAAVERFYIAIHGQTLAQAYAARTARRDPLYTAAYGAANIAVVIEGGINDITSDTTASALYSTMTNYITTAKTAGFKCLATDILPWNNANFTSARETVRTTYNASVVGNAAGADRIIDIASDAVMGTASAPNDTSLYIDALHPTAAGDLRLATEQYKPALASQGIS